MRRGQNGFGAIEGLLFLILVSILGFTGYYVYHTSNNTNSIYNRAASSSISAPASTPGTKFTFKELGVQVTLPDYLKGADTLTSNEGGVQYVSLETPKTVDALHKCGSSLSGGVFVSLAKIQGQYDQNNYPGVANLKQFKDFWISAATPNGIVCTTTSQSDKDDFQYVFSQSNAALREAFKNATLVQ